MKLPHHISLLTAILLSSCTMQYDEDHFNDVDGAFAPYVQQFYDYAEEYGYDFSSYGLWMEFADLDGSRAGECLMYSRPVHIRIDREYWDEISAFANIEDMREDLIFHEMGHGFLDRNHKNDVLQNQDWGSIMCGDELPDDRAPNINFRGMRKPYYIEELFTGDAEAPDWSTYVPDFSEVEQSETTSFRAEGSDRHWVTTNSSGVYARVENGEYVIENSSSTAYFLPLRSTSSVNISQGAYFEVSLSLESGDSDAFAGIAVGGSETNQMHYIQFNKDGYAILGHTACSPFIEIYSDELQNDTNVFGIRTYADTVYFYLNGDFIYHYEIGDLTASGTSYGFFLAGGTALSVDYAELRSSAASLRSAEEETEIAPMKVDDRAMRFKRRRY